MIQGLDNELCLFTVYCNGSEEKENGCSIAPTTNTAPTTTQATTATLANTAKSFDSAAAITTKIIPLTTGA